MKLTNKQLLNSVESLVKLNALELPIQVAFKIAKLSKEIDHALELYKLSLVDLQKKYAKDDSLLEVEHQKLLNNELIIHYEQISIQELESLKIEPKFLYHLSWLLKD